MVECEKLRTSSAAVIDKVTRALWKFITVIAHYTFLAADSLSHDLIHLLNTEFKPRNTVRSRLFSLFIVVDRGIGLLRLLLARAYFGSGVKSLAPRNRPAPFRKHSVGHPLKCAQAPGTSLDLHRGTPGDSREKFGLGRSTMKNHL